MVMLTGNGACLIYTQDTLRQESGSSTCKAKIKIIYKKSNVLLEIIHKYQKRNVLILGRNNFDIDRLINKINRLEKQIEDYYKIFEEVYIICSESNVCNIISVIPQTCGIYSYKQTKSGRYIFKLYRTAKKNVELDSTKQLQILRKTEFYQFFKIRTDISKRKDLIKITQINYQNNLSVFLFI